MRRLLQVRAKNFLSFRDIEVTLGPLNVLVGPNGSGKTNFLSLIEFLGDAVREDLRPALEKRGGYDRVRFRGNASGKVEIGVEAMVTTHATERARDAYTLRFYAGALFALGKSPRLTRVLKREEEFRFKRTKGSGRRLTIIGSTFTMYDETTKALKSPRRQEALLQPESLGLSTLPRLSPGHGGDQVRQIAELFSTFRVFDIDVQKARQPVPLSERESLRSDASNLSAFLTKLAEDRARFAELEDDARAMIPGLERLHFREIGGAAESVVVELEEQGLHGRTSLAEASYGSIRALATLAMLYDPEPPQLTCMEEIDHGLHPHVFDRLVERLRDASTRTQMLVVTHSPALVNRLRASELIVCERDIETGETLMPAVDPEKVRAMEEKLKGKMGLGELWFSGTLGGVP